MQQCETLKRVCRTLAKKENLQLKILQLDVTDESSVNRSIKSIYAESEQIDVLVNNAGYGLVGALEDISMDEIKLQFETNFLV